MSDTITLDGLEDAQAWARKYPETFEAPCHKELAAIEPGHCVKICRASERFWVLVASVNGAVITGSVNNDLYYNPDLAFGQTVQFEARHVHAVMTPGNGGSQLPRLPSGGSGDAPVVYP